MPDGTEDAKARLESIVRRWTSRLDSPKVAPHRHGRLIVSGIAAGTIAAVAIFIGATNPWALSLVGGPTLTGQWVGSFETPTGPERAVWVNIGYRGAGCASCRDGFSGAAETCGAQDGFRKFRIDGDVKVYSGATFFIKFEPEGKLRPPGPRLVRADGNWERDRLVLTTQMGAPDDPHPAAFVPRHADTEHIIGFALGRANREDFRRICAGLDAVSRSRTRQ